MKKLLLTMAFITAISAGYAQTIVSTSPENKKVILEEFTGIYCVFCPDGHAIANSIKNANPENAFIINIHTGGFANPNGSDPDFRTPWGSAIASQSGLLGYPAGTVNRTIFPGLSQSGGNDTAMGRGNWVNAANQTLAQPAYMNMAVEATVDVGASEISVHVEAYYTGDSPEATNMLNVALLQNNTLGPQTGGNSGNNYNHQHRLVDLLTGQWGESVSPTTTGTFIDRTYTYSIPAMYNNVPVVLQDLELVVFMTETTQELISGNGSIPDFTNLPLNNDAEIVSIEEINDQCGLDFGPRVLIRNNGNNALTSVDFDYSVNSGATANYTWTGNLASYEETVVQLPGVAYTIGASNTVDVSIPSDEDNTNNTGSDTFGQTTAEFANNLTLLLNTDGNGADSSWEVKGPDGTVVASGDNYASNQSINIPIDLVDVGCHEFRIMDAGGNGAGSIVLYDSNSDVIYSSPGDYGSGEATSFITNGVLGVSTNVLSSVAMFPNPATNMVTIQNAENANVQVFDILGKVVVSQNNISATQEINISSLQTGTYFVKIEKNNEIAVEKLVILN